MISMARGESLRTMRVAESIRAEAATVLRTEFADPRLQQVVITRVEVTADLQIARVFVRSVGDDDDASRKALIKVLRAASSRLRRMVAEALDLRRAPELRFEIDTGVDAAARIDELLRDINSGK
jgi:ribosome-binding factor A